jgi:hypothetical protein
MKRILYLGCWLACSAASQPGGTITGNGRSCACADGRSFTVGASVFGRDSARVRITGFKPAPVNAADGRNPQSCLNLGVVGQAIEEVRPSFERPYLRRRTLRRGTLLDVCATSIQFREPRRVYSLFDDAWREVAIPEQKAGGDPAVDTAPALDLTGRDLIRLIRPLRRGVDAPEGLDEHDLKEGAYVLARRAVDALPPGTSAAGPSPAANAQASVGRVQAGAVGRIAGRLPRHGRDVWLVEVRPEFSPPPLWRRLVSARARDLSPRRLLLPGDALMEINDYLDRRRVESTQRNERDELQGIGIAYEAAVSAYAPVHLPLAENLAAAMEDDAEQRIGEAAGRLLLRPLPESAEPAGAIVILERLGAGEARRAVGGHLLRQQCFVRLARPASPERFLSVDATEVRVFQPEDRNRAPQGYYAIDLALTLAGGASAEASEALCRFPWARIDTRIVHDAETILAAGFEVRHRIPR